ncbi:FG-GAP repeat domain-containing protein [Streptomyces sp. NPDC057101]|uniref:FG-GAP repeat domain-containing protein n=1 Tax=Streptomyces sp. NPDC057101 TaxID=3346020 RepID=UPI00363404B9
MAGPAKPLNGIGDPAFASGGFKVTRKANAHDLTDNGSADLLARDASGTLWRDDTFDWPVGNQVLTARRTKVSTGWQAYDQIEAAGNHAGGTAGDVVARDTTGVLWSFLGKGDGTFAPRTRIGGGWSAFSQLVGAGDMNNDGRGDLVAYGAGGTSVYLGTGVWSAPFTRTTTNLYAGEGTTFNSVA